MANCEEILKGLYNTSLIDSEEDVTRSFRNWFRSKNFRNFSDAENFGVSASIPIKGILIGIGVEDNNESFSSFLEELEHEDTFSEKYKTKLHTELKTVNDVVVKAWEKCIEIDQEGTKIWIVQNPDQDSFTLNMRYVTNIPGNSDTLTHISFGSSNVIIDDDGPFVMKNGHSISHKLSEAGEFQQFRRKDVTKPLSITVSTLGKPPKTFTLEGFTTIVLNVVSVTFSPTQRANSIYIVMDDHLATSSGSFSKTDNRADYIIEPRRLFFNNEITCKIQSFGKEIRMQCQTDLNRYGTINIKFQNKDGKTWYDQIEHKVNELPYRNFSLVPPVD